VHADPVAVGDCDDLLRCLESGFQELLAAGGQELVLDHDVA
jgi:hypothetical protein